MIPTSTQLLNQVRGLGILDWRTMLVGFDRGLIGASEVIGEAVNALSTSFGDPPAELVALAGADGETEAHIRSLLSKLAAMENPVLDGREQDRWRLAMLSFLRKYEPDEEALLQQVAEVYAIFDYPPDMELAIYYMPVTSAINPRLGDQLPSPVAALDSLIDSLSTEMSARQADHR